MDTQEVLFPWDALGWEDEITLWIDAHMAEIDRPRTGPVEVVHKRTWSAFAKIPAQGGVVYFKAPAPGFPYEAPLTLLLADWQPARITPIIAVDHERGWILSVDSGVTLRERDNTIGQLALWDKMLPDYAQLQMAITPGVDEMLKAGVPDHRLTALPRLYNELLARTDLLRVGLEAGLTQDEHERLVALGPKVADLCAELAAFGIPDTMMHEEIHDANVLVNGERFVYTDWSDCSISHPFASLLVILRATAYRLKLEETSPQITHLRDVYMGEWATYGTVATLGRAADLGYQLGMICRSLSYVQTLGSLPEKYRIENDSIPGWLQDFLISQTSPAG